MDIRKESSTVKAVRYRNRMPRDVVDARSLEIFKARLDQSLTNLI